MKSYSIWLKWLLLAAVTEALLWWFLLGTETDSLKSYIGQTTLLVIGSLSFLFAVIVIPIALIWLTIQFVRSRRKLRRLTAVDG
jgi:hypothetical protein